RLTGSIGSIDSPRTLIQYVHVGPLLRHVPLTLAHPQLNGRPSPTLSGVSRPGERLRVVGNGGGEGGPFPPLAIETPYETTVDRESTWAERSPREVSRGSSNARTTEFRRTYASYTPAATPAGLSRVNSRAVAPYTRVRDCTPITSRERCSRG